MKDIKHLPNDLKDWLERGLENGRRKIAKFALEEAVDRAPRDTHFLVSEVQAYVDGIFYRKSNEEPTARKKSQQVPVSPMGGYGADVTLVSKAGRVGSKGVFDYGRYIGTVDPGHIRWMDTVLKPTIIKPLLGIGLREEW